VGVLVCVLLYDGVKEGETGSVVGGRRGTDDDILLLQLIILYRAPGVGV
jgi:hypothetical protein